MKMGLFAIAVTFFFGLMLGLQMGGKPEVKYKVIHDTDTVTKTVKVEVPIVPSGCRDLVDAARTIAAASHEFDLTTPALLDIMSQLRIAVATKDFAATNRLETRLRAVDSKTIGAIETQGKIKPIFDQAVVDCLKGTE